MPGFEVKWLVTDKTVDEDTMAVMNRFIFPPRSFHYKHRHENAEEIVYVIRGRVTNGHTEENGEDVEEVCRPGTVTFVRKGEPHWTNNPFNEPAEFISCYFGVLNLEKSGYVDMRSDSEKST
jgi:quercetin dioxygenase-like cupin family protein